MNKITREWFGRKLKDDVDFINASIVILKTLLYKGNTENAVEPVFWIIDDCHYLSELGNIKFRSIQKGFLDIYNLSPNGLVLIFAFAGGTENVVDLIPDLLSRRDRRINVHALDNRNASTYIRELNSNDEFSTNLHDDKYYPLTEDSAYTLIDLFNKEKIKLLPRIINHCLDRIVRDAQNDDVKKINSEYLEKKFKIYRSELLEPLQEQENS